LPFFWDLNLFSFGLNLNLNPGIDVSYHIVDLKRQNLLKVGTDESKAKSQDAVRYEMIGLMSGKDFLKSHVLTCRRKVYSDWEEVTSAGKGSRSLDQQPGKHGYRRLIV